MTLAVNNNRPWFGAHEADAKKDHGECICPGSRPDVENGLPASTLQ